jgi:hypothetical protein
MASFSDYRKAAQDCARLARHAPSLKGRQSFAAAARHWMMLAQLSSESGVLDDKLPVDPAPRSHAKPRARDLGAVIHR